MYGLKLVGCLTSLVAVGGICNALTVTVAPTTGVAGTAVTNSIADAITQINAAADAANSVILRSTEGVHALTANTTIAPTAGKSIAFTAQSGQPIIKLQHTSGQYMLTLTPGATDTLTFSGIAFIPPAGLAYTNNVADGIRLNAGNYSFTNCIFSNNNGSDGVASQDASANFVAGAPGNNVGDDWFTAVALVNATWSNCSITGCNDEVVVIITAAASTRTLTFNQGTVIANIGGAAVQFANNNTAVIFDGSAGRCLIAKVGLGGGGADAGIKAFWDATCTLSLTNTDIADCALAAISDFEGLDSISITDSRIALNNSSDSTGVAGGGNFMIDDGSNDNNLSPEAVSITRSTFHNARGTVNPVSFFVADGAAEPNVTFTIINSIFSGAADTFDMLNPNSTGAVNKTFTAVVTAGPDAVGAVGDLGAGSISADPQYVSYTYTIGRNQLNANFLKPSNPAYVTANSTGGALLGGAPVVASVNDYMIY